MVPLRPTRVQIQNRCAYTPVAPATLPGCSGVRDPTHDRNLPLVSAAPTHQKTRLCTRTRLPREASALVPARTRARLTIAFSRANGFQRTSAMATSRSRRMPAAPPSLSRESDGSLRHHAGLRVARQGSARGGRHDATSAFAFALHVGDELALAFSDAARLSWNGMCRPSGLARAGVSTWKT
jgi:hypothetical protein